MWGVILGKGSVEDFGSVGGVCAGQRIGTGGIAIGGSVRTYADQVDRCTRPRSARNGARSRGRAHDRTGDIGTSRRWTSNVGHVENLAGPESKLILIVFGEGPAALPKICQVEAVLSICGSLIVTVEQPVAVRAVVSHLNKDVAGQLAFNRQIVLRGILWA